MKLNKNTNNVLSENVLIWGRFFNQTRNDQTKSDFIGEFIRQLRENAELPLRTIAAKLECPFFFLNLRWCEHKGVKIILPPKDIQKHIGKKLKEAVYAAAAARVKIEESDNDILKLVN